MNDRGFPAVTGGPLGLGFVAPIETCGFGDGGARRVAR